MHNLERSAKKDVKGMIFTIVLYAIGAVSIPFAKIADWISPTMQAEMWCGFICKVLCSALPFYLIYCFGMKKMLWGVRKNPTALFSLFALLVAVTNFPIIPQISGDMSINATFSQLLPYVLYCMSIGLLEEVVFRGNIFPLFMYKFKRSKGGTFWAIVASSAVFGCMHLLNLLGGFSPLVFLQVGYSFLIGCACAVTMLLTGNLFSAIIVHGLFDVGGLMVERFGSGTLWTMENVVVTAIVAVISTVFIVFAFFKSDFGCLYDEWGLNNHPEEPLKDKISKNEGETA